MISSRTYSQDAATAARNVTDTFSAITSIEAGIQAQLDASQATIEAQNDEVAFLDFF